MKGDYPMADDLIGLIDPRTAVVCVSDVIYSTGQRLDVRGSLKPRTGTEPCSSSTQRSRPAGSRSTSWRSGPTP